MENLNEKIVKKLIEQNKTISFMESCTGGFLANEITNVNGSSKVLKVSLVTYSNEYKIKFGVSEKIIDKYTVYSIETAEDMANKVVSFSNANYGIGITGELGKMENNIVYYSIYNKEKNEYTSKKILINKDTRDNMKKEVSNKVLEDLWNILTKN